MKIRKLGVGLLISALVLGGSVSVFAATDEGKEFVGDIATTITQLTSSTQAIPLDEENLPDEVTFLEKVDMSDGQELDISEALPVTLALDVVFLDKVELEKIDGEGTIDLESFDTIDSIAEAKPVE